MCASSIACVEGAEVYDDSEEEIDHVDSTRPTVFVQPLIGEEEPDEARPKVGPETGFAKFRVRRDGNNVIWYQPPDGGPEIGLQIPAAQDEWYCTNLIDGAGNQVQHICYFSPADGSDGELQFTLKDANSRACTLLPTRGKVPRLMYFAAAPPGHCRGDHSCFRLKRSGSNGSPMAGYTQYHITCF